MGVPHLVTRAARLEAPLQCIIRQRHHHSIAGPAAMQAPLFTQATGAGKGMNSITVQGYHMAYATAINIPVCMLSFSNLLPMRMPSILQDVQPASPQQQPGRWQMWQGQQYHWPGRGWW